MIKHKNLSTFLRIFGKMDVKMPRIRLFVGWIVIIVSFSFLIHTLYTGWTELRLCLQNLNYWLLMIALLLYPLGFMPLVWAWHKIMCCIGGCCNFKTNLRLYSLSCLPKRIPGAIWYISARVALYQECRTDYSITLMATAAEVVYLSLSGFLLYLLSMLTGLTGIINPSFGPASVVIGSAILTLIAVVILSWVLRRFQQRSLFKKEIKLKSWDTLQILGLSTAAWLGGGILLYILTNAVTEIPVMRLPDFIGTWSIAGTIGLATGLFVQGLGLREVTLAIMLSNYMPLSLAAAVSLLFRLLLTIGEFVWALLFVSFAR